MATAAFSTIAKEDLSCPVCFELLRDPYTPKLLDCPHVCCALCIRKMIEGGKENIECPECRQLTRIPDGGVDEMRTVLRVRSLAEKHQEMMTNSVQKVFYEEEKKIESVVPTICPDHHFTTVNFFCKNCNIIGCNICMKESHTGLSHNVLKVEAARDEQREQMNCLISCVHEKVSAVRKTVNHLEDLRSKIEKSVDNQRKLIETRAEYAIEKINEEKKYLMGCLRKKAEPRLDIITQERDLLQMEVQDFLETLATVKNTIDTTNPHELVMKHGDLAQTVNSLLDKDLKVHKFGNPVIGMTKYDAYKKPTDMKEILGSIFPIRKLTCEYVAEVGSFRLAADIVPRSNDSFVVHDMKKQKVYNIAKNYALEYFKEAHLPKSSGNEPINGVAVTSQGRYLVARESHIDVYSPSRAYEGQFNFRSTGGKIHDQGYRCASRIAVMNDGTDRVVIGDERNLTLIIVSVKEVVLRVFQISVSPMRICTMANGMVAVSNWREGKLCIVDIESGKEVHVLKIPQILAACYHAPLDCLLVGRNMMQDENGQEVPGSGVIEQYCTSTGRFVGRIAGGLYYPQDLAITGDLLAVADCKSVKVMRVT